MNTENDIEKRKKSIGIVALFFELLHKKDLVAWGNLWNKDAVIIVPEPGKKAPAKVVGLTNQILPAFKHLFNKFKTYDYTIKKIYPTTDPEVVIAEWEATATLRQNNTIYEGQNIAIFKFENEKISEYHDFFNPILFQVITDGLKQNGLTSHL